MDQNVVFKTTAVGGFEKRAVLDYIYQMNEDTEKEKTELLEKVARLEQTSLQSEEGSKKTSNDMRTMERDMATISNELSAEKRRRLELEEENGRLKSQMEELTRNFATVTIEAPKETTEQNDYEERFNKLKAKEEELDKASYQLGRVMLDARADADNVVEKAKAEADTIVSKSETEAADLRAEATRSAEDMVAKAEAEAKQKVDSAKVEEERIVRESNRIAEAQITASKTESKTTMDQAKEYISNVVKASGDVSKHSTSQIKELKEETEMIRQGMQDAFSKLEEKMIELDSYIDSANAKIYSDQTELAKVTLLDISGLTVDELEKLSEKETAPQIFFGLTIEDDREKSDIKNVELKTEIEIEFNEEPTTKFEDFEEAEETIEIAMVEDPFETIETSKIDEVEEFGDELSDDDAVGTESALLDDEISLA